MEHVVVQIICQIIHGFMRKNVCIRHVYRFKQAFDTVDYNIFLERAEMFGVKEDNLKWFRSYLTNRNRF